MMEVKTVFLFLVYFVVLYFVEFSESAADIKNFEKKCPTVLKLIQENKVENYTVACKYSNVNTKKITEDVVLQYACFLSENIVTYICENNLPINSELTLDYDNKTSVCPFDFTQFRKLKNFTYHSIEEELIKKDHCNKVCTDIYELKYQCVILSKVNKFINNYSRSVQVKPNVEEKPQIVPEDVAKTIAKTEESVKTTLKLNSTTEVSKNETTQESSKIKTSTSQEKVPSLDPEAMPPVKEIKSTNITPSLDSKLTSPGYGKSVKEEGIFSPEDIKPPGMDEDPINEDLDVDEDPEELYNQGPNPVPVVHRQDSQKQSTFQESSSRSEVYAGEGFFQAEESHFFFYFLMFSSVIIIGYLAFHNKNKILAYALEGTSGRRNRRRPNPARYRKLESNLEEAMTSNVSQAAESSVVY